MFNLEIIVANILVVGADKLSKITDLTDRYCSSIWRWCRCGYHGEVQMAEIIVMKWVLMAQVVNIYI